MTHADTAMPLGIAGFSYAELYVPERLRDLHDLFCRETAAADPELWAEWDVYQSEPDAARSPIAISDLIVRMAPHVSRFVARLFAVEAASEAVRSRTDEL